MLAFSNPGNAGNPYFQAEVWLESGDSSKLVLPRREIAESIDSDNHFLLSPAVVLPLAFSGPVSLRFEVWHEHFSLGIFEATSTLTAVGSETEPNGEQFNNATMLEFDRGISAAITPDSDKDWFYFVLPAGTSAALLLDGLAAPITASAYEDSEISPLEILVSDDFEDKLIVENFSAVMQKIYVEVSSEVSQDYILLLEALL